MFVIVISGFFAYLMRDTAKPADAKAVSNFATVDIGANASISVSTTGQATCGVVSTFVDLSNFVALERNDQRGEWDILLVRDGETRVIGAVPGVSPNNNRVTLLINPPIVSAISGNNRISFAVENLPGGTQAGIYATGASASLCTFDDVSLLTPVD